MTVDSYSGQKENVLMKACHQCHSLNLSVTSQCPPDKHQLQKYQQGFPAHHLRHLCPLRPQWTPPPDLSRSLGRTALLMVPQKCCAPLPSGVCACSTLCVAPLFSSTSVLPAPAHPLGLCLNRTCLEKLSLDLPFSLMGLCPHGIVLFSFVALPTVH